MDEVASFWLSEATGRRRQATSGDGERAMAMEASEFSFLFEPSLDADVLRVILSCLPCLPLLARAACVSRSWRTVATDPALLMNCFKAQWKLRDVVGRPSLSSSPKFFHRGLRLFAISHPLQRWDTVDSLAVKYDVQVTLAIFSSSNHALLYILITLIFTLHCLAL